MKLYLMWMLQAFIHAGTILHSMFGMQVQYVPIAVVELLWIEQMLHM